MFKVLLVEDGENYRNTLAMALQQRGYSVVCAANGSQAMTILETLKPDLAVLDIWMPQLDGLTVLRMMRLRPELADVPVIVLTGLLRDEYLTQAKALGADSFIKSCISVKELCQRIGEKLEKRMAGAGQQFQPHE